MTDAGRELCDILIPVAGRKNTRVTSNCLFQRPADRGRSVGATASVDPAANVAPQLQKHRTSASVRQRRKSARVLKDPASEGHTHPPFMTSCFSVLTYLRAYMVEQRRKLD
uniref:Uncharacterized protein n=1 Tax=Timema genevievae TaxID=629358 RepID=A0A7R9JVI0_TIMGE|nr:unnamed protein product [Timema genevievae]